MSFAKTLRSRFWSAEIGQFADRPKISDWVRVGGLHPRTSPLQGHSGATREDGECAGWVDLQPRSQVRRGGLRLGRQTDVAMMEATDFVKLHDPARVGEFN